MYYQFQPGQVVEVRNFETDSEGYNTVVVKQTVKKKPELCHIDNGTKVKVLEYIEYQEGTDDDIDALDDFMRTMRGDKYRIEIQEYDNFGDLDTNQGYVLRGHLKVPPAALTGEPDSEPVPMHVDAQHLPEPMPVPPPKRTRLDDTGAQASSSSGPEKDESFPTDPPPGLTMPVKGEAVESGLFPTDPPGLTMPVKDEPDWLVLPEEPEEFFECAHIHQVPYKITRPFSSKVVGPPGSSKSIPNPANPICADCLMQVLKQHPQCTVQFRGWSDDPEGMIVDHYTPDVD